MNENTIESFINFCDDYQIANESFIDGIKTIIEMIKRLILKIRQKFNKDLIIIDKAYIKEFRDLKRSFDLTSTGFSVSEVNHTKINGIDVVLTGSMGTISKKVILSTLEEVTKINPEKIKSSDTDKVMKYAKELANICNKILANGKVKS